MAFGQYSKTTNNIVTAPAQDDDNTTAGSSSFSSWNDLLKSQPRKRAMGCVKPSLLPQRTKPSINHSSSEDEENLTPEDLSDASKTIDADDNSRFESSQSTTRLNVGLQRLGPHNSSRNTTKEFPKPQRASAYPKTKYGHPLSPLSSPIKTPERPMN